jgi:hypothetical protein
MFSLRNISLGAVILLSLVTASIAQAPAPPPGATPLPPLGASTVQRTGKTTVLVYLEENFKGRAVHLEVPCEFANDAQLRKVGIPNDSIQSMKIPDGVTVTLWDGANYLGRSASFTGKVATVGDLKRAASSLKAEFK